MGEVIRREKDGRFIGWYVRYRDADGKRKQRATHQPSHALARRYLVEVEARIARGLVGIPEPEPAAPTVGELCERFLREYSRPRIKDLESYRRLARTALRRALPLLGDRRIDALQAADLSRVRDALAARRAGSSVRTTLAFLSTVFSWAQRLGLLRANPVRGVETPPRRETLEYLSREEVVALLDTAERAAETGGLAERLRYAALVLAIHTGLRKGELLGLRWCDVDLGSRRLSVCRSYRGTPKGGRARHLRLPEAVLPVLAGWATACPRTPAGLVFPVSGLDGVARMGSHRDMLELPALLVSAGCRPLARAWHALRHTFASHFIMAGGNILTLQKILGHSDIKMTLVYAHLAPDFLGEELDRLKFR